MAAQMGDMFQEDHVVSECDVIEQHQMLMDLPHIPNVRDDGQPDLARQQADREEKAGHAGAIGLHKMNRFRLHEVFEVDAVGHMLPQGNANRGDRARQPAVGLDIVRVSRLFNPVRIELGDLLTISQQVGRTRNIAKIEDDLYYRALTSGFTAVSWNREIVDRRRPRQLTGAPLCCFFSEAFMVAGVLAQRHRNRHLCQLTG
jgi:hypothetical protein